MLRRILMTYIMRNKEYYRDKAALSWTFAFPVLIIFAFSFAFSGSPEIEYKIAVVQPKDAAGRPEAVTSPTLPYVAYIPYGALAEAQHKLAHHQVELVIDAATQRYWVNAGAPKSVLAERLLAGTVPGSVITAPTAPGSVPDDAPPAANGGGQWHREETHTMPIRYVDWVVPGILAMNMMFGALWGIGYVVVHYRKTGVLRRFKASPLSVLEFLSAQVLSRLTIILFTSTTVFAGCHALLGFRMEGSYLNLLIVFLLGSATMISLGLIVACRTTSKEFADGILNLIAWPMMLGSGVWFSLEGTNPVWQRVAQALPLTHMVDGMRRVMLEGATLTDLAGHLTFLVLSCLVFITIGAWAFRWE